MVRKKTKKMDNSTKYLYLFIVIIVFTFAFILLINKQKDDNYLADVMENNPIIKPEVGKVIVAMDMQAIYPKYFVVFTSNNHYSLYVYNYYETVSQYNLEFNRLINKIVDYNVKDKMIRYLDYRGYGTYDEIMNNLSNITECNALKIY